MDSKILNKVITIESKEESKTITGNTMVKLTDHTGEKFTFFKKKKDKDGKLTLFSSPQEQWKNMELDEGSTVKIGYVIELYDDKNGVSRESKKIINFQETTGEPTPRTEANTGVTRGSMGDSKNDAFGRRLAIHGFVNAMLAKGATVEVIVKELPALGRLEDAIDSYLSEPQALTDMREKFSKQEPSEGDLEDTFPGSEDVPW